MTPGTLPSRRRLRAAPLPVVFRVAAWRFACWAMLTSPESQESGVWSLEWVSSEAPDSRLSTLDSIEQRAHRLIAMGVPDCLGQQPGNGQHLEAVESALRRYGNRVGDRHFLHP